MGRCDHHHTTDGQLLRLSLCRNARLCPHPIRRSQTRAFLLVIQSCPSQAPNSPCRPVPCRGAHVILELFRPGERYQGAYRHANSGAICRPNCRRHNLAADPTQSAPAVSNLAISAAVFIGTGRLAVPVLYIRSNLHSVGARNTLVRHYCLHSLVECDEDLAIYRSRRFLKLSLIDVVSSI